MDESDFWRNDDYRKAFVLDWNKLRYEILIIIAISLMLIFLIED